MRRGRGIGGMAGGCFAQCGLRSSFIRKQKSSDRWRVPWIFKPSNRRAIAALLTQLFFFGKLNEISVFLSVGKRFFGLGSVQKKRQQMLAFFYELGALNFSSAPS